MNDSRTLVEHFFRHEYGRLVALLTRSLGIRNLELAEDVVQSALSKALHSWSASGIPQAPSAWLFQTARNMAIDALRRSKIENRILSNSTSSDESRESTHAFEAQFDDTVGDESLRLLFLCCHPSIPFESSIAFALKTVSGFSINEITSALLISKANAEKRIARAKEKLREIGTELIELDDSAIEQRIDAVQSTIYLLFNEGYASSLGERSLREELCEEAIRLARMLIHSVQASSSSNSALLALMLMHSARFDARVDTNGSLVTLEDQNRSHWNWGRIREAMDWMQRSAVGTQLSRYHLEAAIAWEHCRATSFDEVDWSTIAQQYDYLQHISPSPMVQLNRAIAKSYSLGPEIGLKSLSEITAEDRGRLRPWWDCAIADTLQKLGDFENAIFHWQDALKLACNKDQRELIQSRILKAQNKKTPEGGPTGVFE